MSKMNMNQELYYNSNDAPPANPHPKIGNSDIYYNCTECPSLIEIISINEETNIIEFKCLNKEKNHEKKIMPIKEYLSKMEKYKQKNLEVKCKEHSLYENNKFVSYCFDCKQHLCKECLISRSHINHYKNIIMEIKPRKEELCIIEEIIKDYNIQIENLKNEKINKEKELNEKLNQKKEIENNNIKKKLEQIIEKKMKN